MILCFLSGGYGRYQKTLLLMGAPIGLTFSFGVSTMGFVFPAIVCEFSVSKEQIGILYSAIYLGKNGRVVIIVYVVEITLVHAVIILMLVENETILTDFLFIH